ncbi:MAG TPA: UbiA-like polyprenyltransferase, partial [Pyrinomonadaceae bacterium]|nr:UbiA-like polyprenyltransferase [Pyrinomonadaceae bacterium]
MLTATLRNIRTTLEMIKIEHTLFALPFAFLGAVLAAKGLPTISQVFWIAAAMVGARSAAMAFNRIVDLEYDRRNPRTQSRAIPSGALSVGFVWAFTIISAALFFVAAAMLNRLTLALAPVALASVLLYSYTKRWTMLSHLALGWCLSIAPAGAWIAVRGSLDSPVPFLLSLLLYSYTKRWTMLSHLVLGWCLAIAPAGAWIAVRGTLDNSVPLLLSLVVMLWTAGFDVL